MTIDEELLAADPLLGIVFDDRYEMLVKIGEGGMGSVYRARDKRRHRDVAIKVLAPSLARDRASVGRFNREAKVTSRLRHPNSIAVYDYGHAKEGLYLAMELLTGETLGQRLKRLGSLSAADAARTARDISRALYAAHALGIIHRDLKPGNVFMHKAGNTREVVKLLDFGIAKFSSSETTQFETTAGKTLGTVSYMSPEQAGGRTCDARSDLYSLGILLHHMLDGGAPFKATEPMAVLLMHINQEPPPLKAQVPTSMRDLLADLLAKAPDARPSHAGEVARRLDEIVQELAATERSRPAVTSPQPPMMVPAAQAQPRATPVAAPPALTDPTGPRRERESTLRPARHATSPRPQKAPTGRTLLLPAVTLLLALGIAAVLYRQHRVEQARPAPPLTPKAAEVVVPGAEERCLGGHAPTCLTMADAHLTGSGVEKDEAYAARLLDAGCQAGSAEACRRLGVLCATGAGVPVDAKRAGELFDRACKAGDREACARLGILHETGNGVYRDLERATVLLSGACSEQVPLACHALGRMEESAHPTRALRRYEGACTNGLGDACTDLARLIAAREIPVPNVRTMAGALSKRCEADQASACTALGTLYETHPRDGTSLDEIGRLYQQACDGDDGPGCHRLALRLVGINPARAHTLLKKACDTGHTPSCMQMIEMKR